MASPSIRVRGVARMEFRKSHSPDFVAAIPSTKKSDFEAGKLLGRHNAAANGVEYKAGGFMNIQFVHQSGTV